MTHSAQRNTTKLCCWTFTWTWDPVLLRRPPLAQRAWSQWREQLTGKRLPSEGGKKGGLGRKGKLMIFSFLECWMPGNHHRKGTHFTFTLVFVPYEPLLHQQKKIFYDTSIVCSKVQSSFFFTFFSRKLVASVCFTPAAVALKPQ